eukprot:9010517-Alexandrium_andersonii.AAC.1
MLARLPPRPPTPTFASSHAHWLARASFALASQRSLGPYFRILALPGASGARRGRLSGAADPPSRERKEPLETVGNCLQ